MSGIAMRIYAYCERLREAFVTREMRENETLGEGREEVRSGGEWER